MSQIMTRAWIGIAIVSLVVMLTGCGASTENSNNVFNNEERHGEGSEAGEIAWHVDAARADVNGCRECHGQDLLGGISNVSCSSCHVNGIATMTGCVSCHAAPPSGTTAPNRAGAHAAHNALAQVTGVCDSCHNNAGSGTEIHNTGTTVVAFLSSYNAKSGAAARNSDGTCSKVSCHGGQTTPAWLSGQTMDVNTQCLSCHAFGTTEYNSFNSGKHDFHVNTRQWNGDCWRCHDYTKLAAVHLTSLNTTTLDGQAYLTLQTSAGYDKSTGKCLAVCHPAYSRVW